MSRIADPNRRQRKPFAGSSIRQLQWYECNAANCKPRSPTWNNSNTDSRADKTDNGLLFLGNLRNPCCKPSLKKQFHSQVMAMRS